MRSGVAARAALLVTLLRSAVVAEEVDLARRAEELKSLKWGMFVCWSFSTFSGKEWTPGIEDPSFFAATGCDTDQWARTAKDAGMGYTTWPDPGYEAGKAVDGDETTRWGAARDAREGWLEVDLGREQRVGRVVILELGYHRTRRFVVEWKDDERWKELARGDAIAGEKALDFPPVTARHVRLSILEASEVPTIEEFQVYPPAAK